MGDKWHHTTQSNNNQAAGPHLKTDQFKGSPGPTGPLLGECQNSVVTLQ